MNPSHSPKISRQGIAYVIAASIFLNPMLGAYAAEIPSGKTVLGWFGLGASAAEKAAAKESAARAAQEAADKAAKGTEHSVDNILSPQTRTEPTPKELEAAKELNAMIIDGSKGLKGTGGVFSDLDSLAIVGARSKTTGRIEEVDNLVLGLNNPDNTGAMLVGTKGVGKSQLMVALAERIRLGQVPEYLRGTRVIEVDIDNALAHTFGDFARQVDKFEKILNEFFRTHPQTTANAAEVIFYFPKGINEESLDHYLAKIRQTYGSRRARIVIEGSEAKLDELANKSSYLSLFYKVRVNELSPPEVFAVLKEASLEKAKAKNIIVSDDVLEYITENAKRFSPDVGSPLAELKLLTNSLSAKEVAGHSPQSAIVNLLNAEKAQLEREIGSTRRMIKLTIDPATGKYIPVLDANGQPVLRANARDLVKELPKRLAKMNDEIAKAQAQFVNQRGDLRDQIARLKEQVRIAKESGNSSAMDKAEADLQSLKSLSLYDVALAVKKQNPNLTIEEILGLRSATTVAERESLFKKVVFNQIEMVRSIMKAGTAMINGTLRKGKPLRKVFYLGPTGVGKTEVAKASGRIDFGREAEVINMGNFLDKTSLTVFTGAGAGYVGFDKGSLLVNTARNLRRGVLVLDELEKAIKANPELQGVLLPVLDEAKMVDPRGVAANFEQIVIVVTSNAITKLEGAEKELYLSLNEKARKKFIIDKLLSLDMGFTPEFLGRFDDFVFANDLENASYLAIIQKEVNKFWIEALKPRGIDVEITDSARAQMAKEIIGSTRGSGRDAIDVANDHVREVYNLAMTDRQYIRPDGKPPVELVIEDGDRWIIDYNEAEGFTHRVAE